MIGNLFSYLNFVTHSLLTLVKQITELSLKLLELRSGINQLDMAEEHAAAAVALDTKVIEDFLHISIFLAGFLFILFPQVANWFAAGDASYGYDHGFTGMISVASNVPWSRSACRFPCAARRRRAFDGHIRGSAP